MKSTMLKKEILRLIEEDREFRYAVMGLLGMSELLERFSRLEERQQRLEERFARLEERQQKLEERFAKLDERFARLEERQLKLEERQQKLEERFNELVKEVRDLRADFNKMLKRIESLEKSHGRLESRVDRLWGAVLYGFNQVRVFAGVSFEEFVRRLFTKIFISEGVIPEGAELRSTVIEGEEINIFYDNPLIVGEVTAHADSMEEYEKFLRKLKAVEKKYCRKPAVSFLVVLSGPRRVIQEMRRRAAEDGVELYVGKEY